MQCEADVEGGEIVAEFVQVMSQFMRLCDSYKHCDDCPVRQAGFSCDCDHQGYSKTGAEEIEHIIMAWSEEHPEAVYPAWRDWLRDLYGNSSMTMTDILESSIDPEIAQRLDIAPRRAR